MPMRQPTARTQLRTAMTAAVVGLIAALGLSACDHRPGVEASDRTAAAVPEQSLGLGAPLDDAAISAQVRRRLEADHRTQSDRISVSAEDGIVTLGGTASTALARIAAEDLALAVPNVLGVDNRIDAPSAVEQMTTDIERTAVDVGASIDDTWITAKVKSALIADARTQGVKIAVSTDASVVKLSGTTRNQSERERAVEIARNIDGVHHVDASQLVVWR
jgi:hyperosmotically inducible periplasmic protein